MSRRDGPEIAFLLSLIGGILILLGGVIMAFWSQFWGLGMMGNPFSFWCPMCGWMMGGYASTFGFLSSLFLIDAVSGIIVIIGALMLNSRPDQRYTWGILILVFSIISLVGMGGFFLGALLGIAGGALALSWRPHQT